VLVAGSLAYRQISWWNGVDSALVVLLIASAGAIRGVHNSLYAKILSVALGSAMLLSGAFGVVQLWPSAEARIKDGLTKTEIVGLIERDLAYWLAKHVGPAGAVALGPPTRLPLSITMAVSADWRLLVGRTATASRQPSESRALQRQRKPRN
jgi:hypothetical protein